ncbi:MAG: lytic murein transglycosylase [Deltaproteobacteria bacterium]|nr:lytic murein transglycosylase [Deltaproteobacteria bacterium]
MACLLVWLVCLPAEASAPKRNLVFRPLEKYLRQQGVPPRQIQTLFSSRLLIFESRLLGKMLSAKESKLNYGQFLQNSVVKKASEYRRTHRALLADMEQKTGVPGEVVVAIIAVESGLGAYAGRWRVFNVLASQAVLDTARGRRLLAAKWPKKRLAELDAPATRARFARRAAWAREELVALLQLARHLKVPPLSLLGSPAGALGICQFVPSSALKWGVDADKNGKIELHLTVDAVYSVGNYLKAHGWKPGASRKEQARVIYEYNHSQPYVHTVLELARRIR